MRRRTTNATLHVLSIISSLDHYRPHIRRVLSLFHLHSIKHFTSLADPSVSSSCEIPVTANQKDLSSIDCSGIAKAVLLKCPHFVDKEEKSFASAALKDLLLDISDVIPETARKFRRFIVLSPENVLEILWGFAFECEKVGIKASRVEILWGIFKWASNQTEGFKQLPSSFEVMASMLIRAEMLRKVELLLLEVERQGIFLDSVKIFSNLIEAYVGVGDLERAIFIFDKMKGHCLVPSLSCYRAFLDCLVQRKRTQLALQVCLHMVERSVNMSDEEKHTCEKVIRLLCRDGMIQESRDLLRKVVAFGLEPSSLAVNEIARGYCEKKDFEDLMTFLVEMKCFPDAVVSNKIINALCSNFGVERAELCMQVLEQLGFRPNELTLGILIGWSCRNGSLRSAFLYLSEILSRGLKPDIYSYHALIGGMFKEGMWKHVENILDEMVESVIKPNLLTFRVLLAGYCKERRFDEAKMMVFQMVNHGLIELSSVEDPLSRAFIVLGLNPLDVRLSRDNDIGFPKAEFFDSLGNGLYLDTDVDEYDKRLQEILEDSLIPDFNSLVMNECGHGNFKAALRFVDEMIQWGQELSLCAFSALLLGLSASRSHVKASASLWENMPKLANQLDQETCNFLVQAYCRKGLAHKGRIVFYDMIQRDLTVKSETYTALIKGLCKKGMLKHLNDCWCIAQNNKWLPELEDFKAVLECLCHQDMLKEALQLIESMLLYYPQLRPDVCYISLEKLCITGFTSISRVLVDELSRQGCTLDHVAYSHLLRGLCNEKNLSVAFSILDTMLAKNVALSLDVCVALIHQLCNEGKFRDASMLYEISLKEESAFSCVQAALIKGFCMTGKLGEAEQAFQHMLSKGLIPDADIYNMLIQGHCQANNLRKSKELFCVMIRKNITLSISSLGKLVQLMCTMCRYQFALGLKDYMLGQSQSDSLIIYNILIFYLLSAEKSLVVNRILHELQEKGLRPDERTYDFLVYGFSKCRDVSSSVRYLFTMLSMGLRPSNRSLRIVISCLCDMGDLGKALELSQEMETRGCIHGSVVQNTIVVGLLSHGKFKEAESFLERMVLKGLIPDTINYDNVVKQFCSYGRLNKAVDLINIMLKKGNLPNSTSYDYIIHGFCKINKLEQAIDFHSEMLDRNLKPSINTWEMLVLKFCQDGRATEAEGLLHSMAQLAQTPTRKMYTAVIDRYRFDNNLKKASELIQMMQLSGYHPDFDTHWSLISHLSNSKDSNNNSKGFLSSLLSGSGFTWKKSS